MKYFTFFILFLCFGLMLNAQSQVNSSPYYETHFIVIGDSFYFNRLDEIEQEKFDVEVEYVDLAYDCLKKGDYESTEYYARKVFSFEELYPDRYFLLTLAAAYMKEKSKFRMYYKSLKEYSSPEEMRDINKKLADMGVIKEKDI